MARHNNGYPAVLTIIVQTDGTAWLWYFPTAWIDQTDEVRASAGRIEHNVRLTTSGPAQGIMAETLEDALRAAGAAWARHADNDPFQSREITQSGET